MKSVTLRSFIRLIHYGLLSLLIVVAAVACGGDEPEEVAPAMNTPAAGGMVIPTATGAPPTAVAPTMPALGAQLFAIEAVRLYADAAPGAIVMSQYSTDSAFTLLAPSGPYSAYPVTVNEQTWYRLRAEDGLVGWAPTAQLASSR
jgi:hypothetical protein